MLLYTFAASVGTGVVTNGVYFLARQAYGFDARANYLLGTALGATYIAGALGVGPALRRAARRLPWLSTRGVLAGVTIALAVLCAVPVLARAIQPGGGSWPVWFLVMTYGPLTGCLWPITEAFLSGGRKGRALRSAVGRFNIVWAGALIASFWLMAPLVEQRPLTVILSLGGVHLLCLPLLTRYGREPGRHFELDTEPHPPVYERMLHAFRALLVTSYVVISALSPFLPTALEKTGLAVDWFTPVASAWLISRLLVFVLMERWHGWHGRWWPAFAGPTLLIGGFAGCMVSAGAASVAGLVASLGAFGLGMGLVYCAALYYAMEVGSAEVDAGGTHEALIGVGYTAGPALMFVAEIALEPGPARQGLIVAALALVNIAALAVVTRSGRGVPAADPGRGPGN